jgi:GT2 family glycosyltransferase
MPGNLNSGITECRGDLVLVCHDHDIYDRTLIDKMVRAMETYPSALFVHCGVGLMDDSGEPANRQYIEEAPPLVPGKKWLDYMLSKFDCPVCANAMVRRSTYQEVGLYSDEFGFIADVEMWMRLSQKGDVAYIAEPLIRLREREKDHEFARTNWPLVDTLLRIHRKYAVKNTLHSLIRTDWYLLRHYLTTIYHKDPDAHSTGKRYLQTSGILLSRIAAHLV